MTAARPPRPGGLPPPQPGPAEPPVDREAKGSRSRLRISGISVVAGAAAAATASAATSVLGVAGTVLGAAVVSAVITVAAAVYDHSLRQAKVRLAQRMEVTARLPRLLADGSVAPDDLTEASPSPRGETTGDAAARRAIQASFTSPLEATAEGVDPTTGELAAVPAVETTAELSISADALERPELPLDALDLEDERGYHWGRIASVSVLVFVLAMAVVTGFELVTGRPLSSLFTDSPARGTTVGHIVRPHRSTPTPTPSTPSPSPSPTSPSPTSPTPTPTTPSPTPSPTHTSPTPSPTPTPTHSPSGTASPSGQASGSASPSGGAG